MPGPTLYTGPIGAGGGRWLCYLLFILIDNDKHTDAFAGLTSSFHSHLLAVLCVGQTSPFSN